MPTSGILLTFYSAPEIERRWRLRQAASWAVVWDRPARMGDLATMILGLVAFLAFPPPQGAAHWPILGSLLGIALNLVLLSIMRRTDPAAYLRRRTRIILTARVVYMAAYFVINRQFQAAEEIDASPRRKIRMLHLCVAVRRPPPAATAGGRAPERHRPSCGRRRRMPLPAALTAAPFSPLTQPATAIAPCFPIYSGGNQMRS